MILAEQGVTCQLSQAVQPGQYRVLIWHPLEGLASVAPSIRVYAVLSGVSPSTSEAAFSSMDDTESASKRLLKAYLTITHDMLSTTYSRIEGPSVQLGKLIFLSKTHQEVLRRSSRCCHDLQAKSSVLQVLWEEPFSASRVTASHRTLLSFMWISSSVRCGQSAARKSFAERHKS